MSNLDKVSERNRVTKLGIDAMIDSYLRLERENAAMRLDADRYRWLRDDKRGRSLSVSSLEWTGSAELSDAAIDAAMKEEGK
jgi:hypothetical protein